MKKHVTLLILLFVCATFAFGHDIYVDGGCQPGGNGDSDNPFNLIFLGIQHAALYPNEASTIYIAPGNYIGNLSIQNQSSDLTLQRDPNPGYTGPVIITGHRSQSTIKVENSTGLIKFDNLSITSINDVGLDHCSQGGGIAAVGCSHVIVDNCYIYSNKAHWGGGIYSACDFMEITNCIIYSNTAITSSPGEDVFDSGGGAIYCSNYYQSVVMPRVDVVNCRIKNNSSDNYGGAIANSSGETMIAPTALTINATQLYNNNTNNSTNGCGGAVFFKYAGNQDTNSSIKIINCTILKNGHRQSVFISGNNAGNFHQNMQFISSIIRYNSGADQSNVTSLIYDVSSSITGNQPAAIDSVRYCNIGSGGSSFSGVTNIDEDPIFQNESQQYFNLVWNANHRSPCIDAGNPDPIYNNIDGTPADMGSIPYAIAHQYKSVVIPAISNCKGWKWTAMPVIDHTTNGNNLLINAFTQILHTNVIIEMQFKPYNPNNDIINHVLPNGNSWFYDNHQVISSEGYKIAISQNHSVDTILPSSGTRTSQNTPIQIKGGGEENWIGYFRTTGSSFSEAFASIWDDLVSIKTQDYCLFKVGNEWQGDMERSILNDGDMVIVRCHEDHDNFVWNQSARPKDPFEKIPVKEFTYTEKSDYVPVYIDLSQIDGDIPKEIGMMVNGECKGAVAVDDFLVELNAYILEEEDMENADVSFSLYYGDDKAAHSVPDCFVMDKAHGNYENSPLKLSTQSDYYQIALGSKAPTLPIVSKIILEQNYPNPFNPITQIRFSLPTKMQAKLDIYNIKGQLVTCLADGELEAGAHSYTWDGTDDSGSKCSSGIYLYWLDSEVGSTTNKMILLK